LGHQPGQDAEAGVEDETVNDERSRELHADAEGPTDEVDG